jgi:hypothetical protein
MHLEFALDASPVELLDLVHQELRPEEAREPVKGEAGLVEPRLHGGDGVERELVPEQLDLTRDLPRAELDVHALRLLDDELSMERLVAGRGGRLFAPAEPAEIDPLPRG